MRIAGTTPATGRHTSQQVRSAAQTLRVFRTTLKLVNRELSDVNLESHQIHTHGSLLAPRPTSVKQQRR
jgi:hypothetical protein